MCSIFSPELPVSLLDCKQCNQCGGHLRIALKLFCQRNKIKVCGLFFFHLHSISGGTDITKIRGRIELVFKFLCIDLSVLVQNVCIDTGNHIDFGMAGIALCGLQITVVEL